MSASKWISYRLHPWNHKVLQIPFFYFSSSFLFIYIFFGMSVALPMLIWMMMMTCYICTQTYANVSFMAPTNINKKKTSHLPQRPIYRLQYVLVLCLLFYFYFTKCRIFFHSFAFFCRLCFNLDEKYCSYIDKWRIFLCCCCLSNR